MNLQARWDRMDNKIADLEQSLEVLAVKNKQPDACKQNQILELLVRKELSNVKASYQIDKAEA